MVEKVVVTYGDYRLDSSVILCTLFHSQIGVSPYEDRLQVGWLGEGGESEEGCEYLSSCVDLPFPWICGEGCWL